MTSQVEPMPGERVALLAGKNLICVGYRSDPRTAYVLWGRYVFKGMSSSAVIVSGLWSRRKADH